MTGAFARSAVAMAAGAGLLLAGVNRSTAEIHDYMILRLIYLNTSCGTQSLARLDPGRDDRRLFKVECRDVASYPQGIVVLCTDIADDRSCNIQTKRTRFDSLRLLRPDG